MATSNALCGEKGVRYPFIYEGYLKCLELVFTTSCTVQHGLHCTPLQADLMQLNIRIPEEIRLLAMCAAILTSGD